MIDLNKSVKLQVNDSIKRNAKDKNNIDNYR